MPVIKATIHSASRKRHTFKFLPERNQTSPSSHCVRLLCAKIHIRLALIWPVSSSAYTLPNSTWYCFSISSWWLLVSLTTHFQGGNTAEGAITFHEHDISHQLNYPSCFDTDKYCSPFVYKSASWIKHSWYPYSEEKQRSIPPLMKV